MLVLKSCRLEDRLNVTSVICLDDISVPLVSIDGMAGSGPESDPKSIKTFSAIHVLGASHHDTEGK